MLVVTAYSRLMIGGIRVVQSSWNLLMVENCSAWAITFTVEILAQFSVARVEQVAMRNTCTA